MIYTYLCGACGEGYEAERSVDERHDIECPHCGDDTRQQIQLHPVRGTMVKAPQLITEAQVNAEHGADWRETPGSRRMKADEPERLYSVAGDTTRRKTKKARR